jgi:hypothetical protein
MSRDLGIGNTHRSFVKNDCALAASSLPTTHDRDMRGNGSFSGVGDEMERPADDPRTFSSGICWIVRSCSRWPPAAVR